MTVLTPIAPDLWTDEPEPRLIGGRLASGEIVFPLPRGDAAAGVEPWPLQRKGRLWSFTSQDFRPKPPYAGPGEGPHDFQRYLVGYVELPGEVIVESLIVEAALDQLRIGMAMELVIVRFNAQHTTFAFRPETPA
jgi:uncharacterized OB-fold protein